MKQVRPSGHRPIFPPKQMSGQSILTQRNFQSPQPVIVRNVQTPTKQIMTPMKVSAVQGVQAVKLMQSPRVDVPSSNTKLNKNDGNVSSLKYRDKSQ